jgi:hypothetical protein
MRSRMPTRSRVVDVVVGIAIIATAVKALALFVVSAEHDELVAHQRCSTMERSLNIATPTSGLLSRQGENRKNVN